MIPGIRLLLIIVSIAVFTPLSQAQPVTNDVKEKSIPAKPYRILTSGKSITIKSTKDIRSILVWTTDGHRVHEQKDINANSYNFRINISSKVFFLMVQLSDGKTYSEKFGIQ